MRLNIKRFFLTIILPTLLTIGLFILLIFRFIIPYFQQNMLNQKKEMIRELISGTISIASTCLKKAESGEISEQEAMAEAVRQIGNIRYGKDNKDYCWITDSAPRMIYHPYRPDLNGTHVGQFTDPEGKKMFVEMVAAVSRSGEGYVDYMWQWMDDPARIVPKISYVREFKPWGWIIGTGIYIEDIYEEISAIQRKLLGVLLVITAAIALLLIFIVRQNLRTEIERNRAETELIDSRERYKTLVEASSEGTWMILDGSTIYYNKKLEEFIPGVSRLKLSGDFREIISPDRPHDIEQIGVFNSGPATSLRLETRITPEGKLPVNVILSLSKITLSEKQGYIVIIKELGTPGEINALRDLAVMLRAGYFHASPGKNGRFLELSPSAVLALGYSDFSELRDIPISDLSAEKKDYLKMLRILDDQGMITRFPLMIRTRDQKLRAIRVSARLIRDDQEVILGSDGIIEDITGELEKDRAREDLIGQVQGMIAILHQPVENLMRTPVTCPSGAPVRQALELMGMNGSDHVIAIDSSMNAVGIVTDGDILERAFLTGLNPETAISALMSAPLISTGYATPVGQACDRMIRSGIGQLGIKNDSGVIMGVFSLSSVDHSVLNPFPVTKSGDMPADSPGILRSRFLQLPDILSPLIRNSCHSRYLTSVTSGLADHSIAAVAEMIVKELGPAPVPYAVITLGSMGRSEPSLTSDQDNALIYKDPPAGLEDLCSTYFNRLASRLNPLLAEIGYPLCPGDIMAGNPRWNQPLKVWKQYFSGWISEPDPVNLMETATFFDLRTVYGDNELVIELRDHIKTSLKRNPVLRNLLARECIQYKTPMGMFGRIHTDDDDPGGSRLNLKNPIRILVNMIRLYALANGIDESNTLRRLRLLSDSGILSARISRGLEYAYDFLTKLQFLSQIRSLDKGEPPSASIDISGFSEIETDILKAVFSGIGTFQAALKHDFSILD